MFGKNKDKNKPPEKPPKNPYDPKIPHPDLFEEIKINIYMGKKDIVNFYIPYKYKSFKYDEVVYKVNYDAILLSPTKNSYEPNLYYNKGNKNPLIFKNNNEGIPSRALNLLWNSRLYKVLVELEGDRTNFLVIIMLLVNAIIYGIGFYFKYGGH